MTMPPRLRSILLLLALVLVSGLTGAVIGHRLARTAYERRTNIEHWDEFALDYVDKGVGGLTPAQRVAVKAGIDDAVAQLKVIRGETTTRSSAVMRRMLEQLDQVLTPEQRAAFQRIRPKDQDLQSLDVLKVDRPKP